jgi:uncharacterized spore protein YtfJ
MTMTFNAHAEFVKTTDEWRAAIKGTKARTGYGAARAYAKENGVAVVMLADDGARMFYRKEDGSVSSKLYYREQVRWVDGHPESGN